MKHQIIISTQSISHILPVKLSSKKQLPFKSFSITASALSALKNNQCGVIPSYGLVYMYTASMLYVFNNSNLSQLISNSNINKYDTLLNETQLCTISFNEEVSQIEHDKKYFYILPSGSNCIYVIDIHNMLTQQEPQIENSLTFPKQIKKFTSISNNDYLILTTNNEIQLKKQQDNIEQIIISKCIDYYYYHIDDLIITVSNERIHFINKNTLSQIHSLALSDILLNKEKETVLSIYYIKEYIILSTSQTVDHDNIKTYIININIQTYAIINVYYNSEQIVNDVQLSINNYIINYNYLPEYKLLFVINKASNNRMKMFIINDDINDNNNSENKINEININVNQFENESDTYIIGSNVISFKFDSYDNNEIIINNTKHFTPPICVNFTSNGYIEMFYLINHNADKCLLKQVENDLFNLNILNKANTLMLYKQITPQEINLLKEYVNKLTKIIRKEQMLPDTEHQHKKINDIVINDDNNFLLKMNMQINNQEFNILDSYYKRLNLSSFINLFKCILQLIPLVSNSNNISFNTKHIMTTLNVQQHSTQMLSCDINELNLTQNVAVISNNTSLENIINENNIHSYIGKAYLNKLIQIINTVNKYSFLIEGDINVSKSICNEFHNQLEVITKENDAIIKYHKMFEKCASSNDNKRGFEIKIQNDIVNKYMHVFSLVYNELKSFYDNNIKGKLHLQKETTVVKENNVTENNDVIIKENSLKKKKSFRNISNMLMNRKCMLTYVKCNESVNVGELFGKEGIDEEEEHKCLEMVNEQLKEIEDNAGKEKVGNEKIDSDCSIKERRFKMNVMCLENLRKFEELVGMENEIERKRNEIVENKRKCYSEMRKEEEKRKNERIMKLNEEIKIGSKKEKQKKKIIVNDNKSENKDIAINKDTNINTDNNINKDNSINKDNIINIKDNNDSHNNSNISFSDKNLINTFTALPNEEKATLNNQQPQIQTKTTNEIINNKSNININDTNNKNNITANDNSSINIIPSSTKQLSQITPLFKSTTTSTNANPVNITQQTSLLDNLNIINDNKDKQIQNPFQILPNNPFNTKPTQKAPVNPSQTQNSILTGTNTSKPPTNPFQTSSLFNNNSSNTTQINKSGNTNNQVFNPFGNTNQQQQSMFKNTTSTNTTSTFGQHGFGPATINNSNLQNNNIYKNLAPFGTNANTTSNTKPSGFANYTQNPFSQTNTNTGISQPSSSFFNTGINNNKQQQNDDFFS